MSHIDETHEGSEEETTQLIIRKPKTTYKTKLVYSSIITSKIGEYINSYTIYFNETSWLVIQFNGFSIVYKGLQLFVTGPFKTREYIDYNTHNVVNRPNQPLYIIISHLTARVTYEEPHGDVLYNSHFDFYGRYEYKVTELELMTLVYKNNKF
jgi:hypothetical protein